MKKTRFFYEINYFLIVLLGWMLLFSKAFQVNKEKNNLEKDEVFQMEIIPGVVYAGKTLLAYGNCINLESGRKIAEFSLGTAANMKNAVTRNGKTDDKEKRIRVLLMDSDYRSYYHSCITIKQNGMIKNYTVNSPELKNGGLRLENENGFYVLSIQRQVNPPFYSGVLEIKNTSEGLLLINEVPLEIYLQSVVPSEMPSSYEMQALMAQAVCARTYAICQIKEGKLKEKYDADVDDSVNFQVYNNFSVSEKTSSAVEATKGKIICQNGEPITAYYFSTSSGVTSTDEIWGLDKSAPYLQSVDCEFDQKEPWSSWHVKIPWAVLEKQTEKYTETGKLKTLQLTKKNSSGGVCGLLLTTQKETIEINGEYDIRSFLCPEGLEITEKDGNTVQGGKLLPSAYFDMKIVPEEYVELNGGGLGHGVGMSQTGANEMAKEGYTWEEILHYFFRNITISNT